MNDEIVRRLRANLTPTRVQQDRIRSRLMTRIDASPTLEHMKALATPSPAIRERVWQRILERIEPVAVSSLLGRLKDLLTPPMYTMLVPRFAPVPVASRSQQAFKWAAAALVLVILLRETPLLFLAAPRSSAESAVLVVPTRGSVSVSIHNLWEPVTGELRLKQGAHFRTDDGEATFSFNDDGNVRMGRNTEIMIHDVTDRPEPALNGPTFTVLRGQVWVQGFIPEHIRGIIVALPHGTVDIHEGSISIAVGETVDVHVWDRHARIEQEDRSLLLVAGERTELVDGRMPLVKKIALHEDEKPWPTQNLAKDAVHRREIAQLQRERFAARAGILPSSPLYPVKRVAEAVDVLLTFGGQQRVEKQLQLASTRLDEAAAILASGGTGATAEAALAEYRTTLLSVATGSGGGSVTQFLVRQQVAEDTAQVSAARHEDTLYVVKRAALEASAELPSPVVDTENVEGVLFLDTLDSIQEAVESGDVARAKHAFDEVQLYLDSFKSGSGRELSPEVEKEAVSVLSSVALSLENQSGTGETLGDKEKEDLLQEVATYLPAPAQQRITISEEEAERIVQRIFDRVFIFKLPRSRWSQLMYEMKQLSGNPDEGTILRHLYRKLPENGLARYVRTAIVELGKEKAEGN